MTDKRVEIVELLIQKTSDGGIKWETSAANSFYVRLGENVVLLTEKINSNSESDFFIEIFNDSGNSVEKFSDVELYNLTSDPWYSKMQALLVAARRNALGTDKVFDEILGQLKRS